MPDKFQNKYRISSARLQHWDYGSDALYFVTICTQNREHYFGEIADGKMQLSETGKIAHLFWFEIPNHFPFVHLGEFVVMPNHVHGIIIIDKTGYDGDVRNDAIVKTQNFASLPPNQPQNPSNSPTNSQNRGNIFGPQSQNLASIIRGYKIGVTKFARNNNIPFSWQPRFHNHIIRNHESFQRISDYIANNPVYWRDDNFY
jgi:REP element-mobilizing transposase RayT